MKVSLAQLTPVWLNRDATLDKVCDAVSDAANHGADLIAFSEGFVPGYPFWVSSTGGAAFNDPVQKSIFAHYSDQAVCIEDGHLDPVIKLCRDKAIACYLGIIERPRDRTGHSLYCSLVYISKDGEILSVHRKLQPTYEERLVWSHGDGHGLRTHRQGEWTVSGLNCWENWMPLARAAMYGQGTDLHIAVWPGSESNTRDITPFIAKEGRMFCVSVSSVQTKQDIPKGIVQADLMQAHMPDILTAGGSCVAAPDGTWILEPQNNIESLFYADIDLQKVRQERQNFDPAGHYSRPDVTQLNVIRTRQTTVCFKDN